MTVDAVWARVMAVAERSASIRLVVRSMRLLSLDESGGRAVVSCPAVQMSLVQGVMARPLAEIFKEATGRAWTLVVQEGEPPPAPAPAMAVAASAAAFAAGAGPRNAAPGGPAAAASPMPAPQMGGSPAADHPLVRKAAQAFNGRVTKIRPRAKGPEGTGN
ncbi:MAG: hypothetical protein LW650_06425 [Planctomycetaceae bacterium]|nr:hypothetical protein [Phycisphaerales bacterium]MCE2653135.1 hypothetical protein [Planctomycetaceae bacterium]